MDALLERIHAHDESAIPDFIQAYGPLIRYVTEPILQQKEDIEECLDDIVLKTWNKIDLYDASKGSFEAWLCSLSRNHAIDMARKKGVETISLDEDMEVAMSFEDKGKTLPYEIVDTLPVSERKLFYRRYYYFQSIEQIAKETGLTIRSVEGKLYRLKKKLAKKVKEHEE